MIDASLAAGASRMSWRGMMAARVRGGSALERALLWGMMALLAVLVLYPIGMLLLRSLQTEDLAHFTLDNYVRVFQTPRLVETLANSLYIASGATALAIALGTSLAWLNARTNMPGAQLCGNLNLVPFFTPSFVGAIAWTILASKNQGLINHWAAALFGTTAPIVNIYSGFGIIWVLALYETPLVYLFVAGAFRKMDPALEEAARLSGSGLLGTTMRVTLPLALPAILSAALLIFVAVLGAFEVPLVLGIPARINVLTTELFAMTSEYPARYNMAATMCSLLLATTGLALILQRRVLLRRSYVTVTGKAYRPQRIDIGRGRYLALAWNLLYLLLAVGLPLFALVVNSLERIWTGTIDPAQFTLANYRFVLFDFDIGRRALVNTLILATLGATIGAAIGTITAYLVFRSRVAGRATLDLLSGLPVALPSAILAVGIAICWIKSPLYGTLGIILIGFVAKYTPYAQRSISATLLSLSAELDECSRVSGASWWRTMRHVVLPLLRPGIVAGWLLLFIILVRELGMSLFLYGAGTETISIAVYLLFLEKPTPTAACCVLQIIVILVAVTLLRRVTRDDEFSL